MKAFIPTLFLLTLSTAFAIDKTQTLTKSQFEEFSVQSNGVTLNNFGIAQKKAWLSDEMTNIEVSFSARNKTNSPRHFVVMLVGTDVSGKILWSLALEPLMSTLAESTTTTVEKSIYCVPGTLDITNKIWVRVVGDF